MNPTQQTTQQRREPRTHGVRRLPIALALGAALGAMLRPAVRRGLAAAGAAALLAASSLLTPQPAAAGDGRWTMHVALDNVQFTQVSDGCCPDTTLEVYGGFEALTNNAVDRGAPYGTHPQRVFGTWGKDPCETYWHDSGNGTCAKKLTNSTYYFAQVLLCNAYNFNFGNYTPACDGAYTRYHNEIMLMLNAGETITVTVVMQDYDSGSANDNVCVGNAKVGPFTNDQIYALKLTGNSVYGTISMPNNGHAACTVHFRVQ